MEETGVDEGDRYGWRRQVWMKGTGVDEGDRCGWRRQVWMKGTGVDEGNRDRIVKCQGIKQERGHTAPGGYCTAERVWDGTGIDSLGMSSPSCFALPTRLDTFTQYHNNSS
ncbi:hypothetical protein E2C01_087155 [Portunus trituberculatus]|uniref:Uncharacterized protein n=1 Tax=Portunus trituberculatus TaxID=210409 RepID=A0A5B7JCK7_PORTR|nr:hypothetical protein [Portunus trituberculatus]